MNRPIPPFTSRRDFLKTSAAAALGGALASSVPAASAVPAVLTASQRKVQLFYESLSAEQRQAMCFDWDYRVNIQYGRQPLTIPDPNGVLLRTHVSNAWHITPYVIGSPFYTEDQYNMIMEILEATLEPDWPDKLIEQAEDDTKKPWGTDQAVAIFGTPGHGRFQFVLTGFHLTVRAGYDPDGHAAFGGPISHGHQPSGFYEKPGHPNNIFWYQAQAANQVYQILDGRQREKALFTGPLPYFVPPGAPDRPESKLTIDRSLIRTGVPRDDTREPEIRFRDPSQIPGLPVGSMSPDQKEAVRKTLQSMVSPYRQEYQEQVMACLQKQGGLEACRLTFYRQKALSDNGEWDNWRLEGPSFVWYLRGSPHVHVWIHVADDPGSPISTYFG